MTDPMRSTTDIRLVILDIDGTLTGSSNQVSPTVRKAIQSAKQKGVRIGIATGRMFQSAQRFHFDIEADMPLSAYQGAFIQDPATNTLHHHWVLDRALAQHLLDHLADLPFIVHVYIDDQLYVRELTELSQLYAERSQVPLNLLSSLGSNWPTHPTKILAMTEDPAMIEDLMQALRRRFPAQQLYLTRSVPTFLEATHPEVNKGNAVKYLTEELLGLTPENVMVVGDSDNDIEMLSYAGLGVAMGNARPEIQAYAHWIAPTVDEDGVAAALEEFVL